MFKGQLTQDDRNKTRSEMISALKALLSSPDLPIHSMNFHQLDGYVRALAGGPRELEPDAWMPLVFNDRLGDVKSATESSAITNALICLYTWHREQISGGQCDLPFAHEYQVCKDHRLDAEQWARGFMQGYIVLQDIWGQFLAEQQTSSKLAVILPLSIHDEIDAILQVVSWVADAEFAVHQGASLAEVAESFNRLPEIIIQYGRIGQLLRNLGKE